jgi:formylglycine-generating enzyme required for sulfatase activity
MRFAVMLLAGVLAASAAASGPSAPREFDDCHGATWCPRMVAIPAGTFDMGAPANEPGAMPEEGPVHKVRVRSFAAGKFDVTRAQWAAFVAATSRETRLNCTWTGRTRFEPDPHGSWKNLGFEQDGTHPAVCISWIDAQDYVRWLSKRTGHTYRLLTEAEWEYAARGGTTTAYPWGATASHEFANYGADECCSPRASGRDRWDHTSPVGSFPPNAFGLYDMQGNVLQWVQDCLSMPYADPPLDGSANEKDVPLHFTGDLSVLNSSSACEFRMVRGGDWGDTPAMIRSASRNFGPVPGASLQDYSSGGVGFRVARTLP